MGKKGGGAKPDQAVQVSEEVRQQVDALRNTASQHYLKKEFAQALDAYGNALQLLPSGGTPTSLHSDLQQKKAFCYMSMRKYKEAIKEADNILKATPDSVTAHKTRIKALEHMGQTKQALAEVQALNKDHATDETRDIEKRLKEAASGRTVQQQRPASASAASPSSRPQPHHPFQLTIKAMLGNESKLVTAPLTVSYYELLQAVKAKYPDAGPFRLQWTDREGDNVTITSRHDIQNALSELILAFQKQHGGQHAPRLLQQNGLPPLKLQVVPVEKQSQVPKPPLDELFPRKDAEPVYEPEEWLLEFARLFSEVTGLDTHTPLEHQNMGADKLQQAMSDTLGNEEAGPLFDQAGEHFRDAAVVSLIQWGNVYIVKADRQLQGLAKAGMPIKGKELASVMALYDETQKKIEEGLRIKPESWEAVGSLAQLEWERAKAKLGYVMPLQPPDESSANKSPEQQAADSQAAVLKQLSEVLSKINKQDVGQVGSYIKACNEKFEQALALAKKQHDAAEAVRAAKAKEAVSNGAKDQAKATEEPPVPLFSTPPANVLVMHGNILYDWSQVLAETKAEPWRPVLDKAVEKFRGSGAPEPDIRAALKNHSRRDELDLGPDPEPPAPPKPAAPAGDKKEKQPAPKAEGLPSLERKTKPQDEKKKGGGGASAQQNTAAPAKK